MSILRVVRNFGVKRFKFGDIFGGRHTVVVGSKFKPGNYLVLDFKLGLVGFRQLLQDHLQRCSADREIIEPLSGVYPTSCTPSEFQPIWSMLQVVRNLV